MTRGSKSPPVPPTPRLACAWSAWRDRRGGEAVEYAIVGPVLVLMMLAIIDLGLLGFSMGGLAHGVRGAARAAVMQASDADTQTGTMSCPPAADIIGYFNQFAHPPLPLATSAASPGTPILAEQWTNNNAGTGINESPGVYLTLTVHYEWTPLFLSLFKVGVPLSITTVATVMGSTGAVTIDSSCGA